MEEPAQRVRRLARNLCPGKPLGENSYIEKAFLRLQQLGWGDPFVVRRGAPSCGSLAPAGYPVYLLMDRAYEGDKTRTLAAEPGYTPVVPPKRSRKDPWDYLYLPIFALPGGVCGFFHLGQCAYRKPQRGGLVLFAKASGPVGQGLFFVYSLLLYHPLYH